MGQSCLREEASHVHQDAARVRRGGASHFANLSAIAVPAHDLMLIISAGLMGLAGAWHCSFMCGSLCAGFAPRWPALLAGRLLAYCLAGAVLSALASGIGAGAAGALGTHVFRPIWALAHVAAIALGCSMLLRGEQPHWIRAASPVNTSTIIRPPRHRDVGWAAAGVSLVALPCGLLQAALLTATLSSGPASAASTMAAFALSSTPGLVAWPAISRLLGRGGHGHRRIAVRLSGGLLIGAASWALVHGLWTQVREIC